MRIGSSTDPYNNYATYNRNNDNSTNNDNSGSKPMSNVQKEILHINTKSSKSEEGQGISKEEVPNKEDKAKKIKELETQKDNLHKKLIQQTLHNENTQLSISDDEKKETTSNLRKEQLEAKNEQSEIYLKELKEQLEKAEFKKEAFLEKQKEEDLKEQLVKQEEKQEQLKREQIEEQEADKNLEKNNEKNMKDVLESSSNLSKVNSFYQSSAKVESKIKVISNEIEADASQGVDTTYKKSQLSHLQNSLDQSSKIIELSSTDEQKTSKMKQELEKKPVKIKTEVTEVEPEQNSAILNNNSPAQNTIPNKVASDYANVTFKF